MELYLLKFSACLLVFLLVYVLFLERQTMHHFKRFYLLGAMALALVIPTLTITEYVEPVVTNFETSSLRIPTELSKIEPIETPSIFTLESILWLIYGIGVLLFFIRFVVNLVKMQRRISKNVNLTKRSFVYVLLCENLVPHSFFKYIFFNKMRYESNAVPTEVKLHEETHAKQLHSLDIMILELLQIVFWFHPLIYILKHHIKLNHEFLADQGVLKQGSDAKTYQNIILQFSSSDSYRNTQDYALSSAINYSSTRLNGLFSKNTFGQVKKRFTVMKTQTSKTRIWLSTLLVFPVIAILFYSFANNVKVEKDLSEIHPISSKLSAPIRSYDSVLHEKPIMAILINRKGALLVDDVLGSMKTIESKLKTLKKSHDNTKAVIVQYDPSEASEKVLKDVRTLIRKYDFKVIHVDASPKLPIMSIIINSSGELLIDDKLGTKENIETKLKTLSISHDKSSHVFVKYDPTNASEKVLNEVKTLIKKYNFRLMQLDASTDTIIPPPPPAPPAPPKKHNSHKKGGPNANNYEVANLDKVDLSEINDSESTLDFVIRMAKNNAKFFNEGKSISSDIAIDQLKKNPKLNVTCHNIESKQPLVYIFKKPILLGANGKLGKQKLLKLIINGKKVDFPKLTMTKIEVNSLKLTTENGNVTEFKLKIPGKPTVHIKGNSFDENKNVLTTIASMKTDMKLVLFSIKDASESEIEPLVITIID
ncbi:M56 family metallopeptidase [Winogradskyella forsetii]|uniref:M56 family metallopeptidase n=1 Tax=Winogradskyella forsetii TaxID=2686077 RepID=UPI0015B88EFF|nr:M56 family metallopeptidase [Winogradskyella forsetii]